MNDSLRNHILKFIEEDKTTQWFTATEAAVIFGLSLSKLLKLIKSGDISSDMYVVDKNGYMFNSVSIKKLLTELQNSIL